MKLNHRSPSPVRAANYESPNNLTGDLKPPASLPLHKYEPDTPHPHHICAPDRTAPEQKLDNPRTISTAPQQHTNQRAQELRTLNSALDRTLRVGTCCAGDSSSSPCSPPCSARGSFSPPSSSESSKSGPWSSGVRSAAKSTFSDTPRRNETRTRQPTHDRNNNLRHCVKLIASEAAEQSRET